MTDAETWIRTTLAGPWPLLWPLRHRHAELLRRAAADLPGWGYAEARAVFGVDDAPAPLAGTLYRDLYLATAPRAVTWDAAIGALRRGDPAPLRARLAAVDGTAEAMRRAWYEVTTAAGRVMVVPRTRVAGAEVLASFALDPPILAGGAPEVLLDAPEVARALHAELAAPLTLERHRAAVAAIAAALRAEIVPLPVVTPAAQLLAHHADDARAAAIFEGVIPPGVGDARALAEQVAIPDDAAAFAAMLRAALGSAVRPRRWLAYRLLRLAGELGDDAHPDDRMPAPAGAPAGLYA